MARKRYIFFDIDGTLIPEGYSDDTVPESTLKAIALLKEAGHFICLATGRAEALGVKYMRQLGFENMVSDGGYGVTIGGKLLGITPLPKDRIIRLVDECRKKGFPWGIQTDNSDTRLVPDGRFEAITHDFYMKTRIVPGLDPRDHDVIYKMYVVCTPGEEEQLEALKELPWCRFHKEYIFVEPDDKAFGIKKILDHLGADYRDAVVFGDWTNDISMFRDEWTKVAMGNAVPELKALADYVTAAVDDDGIYKACEALGLFEPVTPSA